MSWPRDANTHYQVFPSPSDIAAVLREAQGEITQLEIEISTHEKYHMPDNEDARVEAAELGRRYAALRYAYTRQTRSNEDTTITSMEIILANHSAALRLKKDVSALRDDVSRTSKKYNPSLSSRTDVNVVGDGSSFAPDSTDGSDDNRGSAANILFRVIGTISGRGTRSRQTPEYPGSSQPEPDYGVTVRMQTETEELVFRDEPGGRPTAETTEWIGQTLDAMPVGQEFESGIQRVGQELPNIPPLNNSSISLPWERWQ